MTGRGTVTGCTFIGATLAVGAVATVAEREAVPTDELLLAGIDSCLLLAEDDTFIVDTDPDTFFPASPTSTNFGFELFTNSVFC